MKNLDKQKRIEKQVEIINERAAKNSLNKKKTALFIDPLPDNLFIIRNKS